MRFFNAAGLFNAEDLYCLPPIERLDLEAILSLIVEREYGLGRKRTDLLLIWPLNGTLSDPAVQRQKVVLELKIVYGSLQRTIQEGLPQTASYYGSLGDRRRTPDPL